MSETATEASEATEATESTAVETTATETVAPSGPYAKLFGEDGTIAPNAGDAYKDEWPEHAEFLARFAGKDLKAVLDSHKSLASQVGKAGSMAVLPGKNASKEDIAAYREKMGVPGEATEYGLSTKPADFEGEWNGEFGAALEAILHEGHVPKAVAEKLAARYHEEQGRMMESFQRAETEAAEAEERELREMWGDEYDVELSRAQKIAKGFGFNLDDFSTNDVAVLLAKIGRASDTDQTVMKALNLSETAMAGSNPRVEMDKIARDPEYQKGHGARYEELRKQFHGYANQLAKQQSQKS